MDQHFNNTLIVGKQHISLPSCNSTNDLALEMAANQLLFDGAIISTEHQTKGRGQRGNTWLSEAGQNLTCSFYFKPGFLAIDQQFDLNRVVSLAIKEAIHSFSKELQVNIKWPNDILIGDKKVAGILIENTIGGKMINQSIIGIGLNINQVEGLMPKATSLRREIGEELDRNAFLGKLAQQLEKYYFTLKRGEREPLIKAYQASLFLLNKWAPYEDEAGAFKGMIKAVADDGTLDILKENGEIAQYQFKEVIYL